MLRPLALAATLGISSATLGISAAHAVPACHEAGSGYTLVTGNAGNVHLANHNDDFLWTVAYDDSCEDNEIWSICNQAYGQLEALTYTWSVVNSAPVSSSTFTTCPTPHHIVPLAPGESHAICQQGSSFAPYYHTYYRNPPLAPAQFDDPYGAVCDATGKRIELGPSGGPFQVLCDSITSTYPQFMTRNFFTGQLTPTAPTNCLPNSFSAPESFFDHYVEPGVIMCPADGVLEYAFTDYGPALAGPTGTHPCTPGDPVVVSDLPW